MSCLTVLCHKTEVNPYPANSTKVYTPAVGDTVKAIPVSLSASYLGDKNDNIILSHNFGYMELQIYFLLRCTDKPFMFSTKYQMNRFLCHSVCFLKQ